jgi:hypothetical protein
MLKTVLNIQQVEKSVMESGFEIMNLSDKQIYKITKRLFVKALYHTTSSC